MTAPVFAPLAEIVRRQGRAALVTVVEAAGSTPREAGARMIVAPDGATRGTIGGGTLEWQALAEAQARLAAGDRTWRTRSYALGPDLGQCCGGRARIGIEAFGADDLAVLDDLAAREAAGSFAVEARIGAEGRLGRTVLASGSGEGAALTVVSDGAMREVFGDARRTVVLCGAGHVGRALVLALAALPFRVVWVDPRPNAFPAAVPGNVTAVEADPLEVIARAGEGAFVLAVTHSHALDWAIVDAGLRGDRFPHVGVIGSATKRARFVKRLAEVGHAPSTIARLVCPIGAVGLASKLPAVIAAGVAVELLLADEAARAVAPSVPSRLAGGHR